MGRENTPCLIEVLSENMDDVIEYNACDKADDIRCKKRIRKEDLVDYVHQKGSGGESRLQLDLYKTGEADLRDPQQISEVDLEKIIRVTTTWKSNKRKI